MYRFNEKQQLMESIFAEEGSYQGGEWVMKNVTSTGTENKEVTVTSIDTTTFKEFLIWII